VQNNQNGAEIVHDFAVIRLKFVNYEARFQLQFVSVRVTVKGKGKGKRRFV